MKRPPGRADIERPAAPNRDARRPALGRIVPVRREVDLIADPVLRGEHDDVAPDGGDRVLDRVERLDPGDAVRGDLHGALRVPQVDEEEPGAPAAPVDAADDRDGAVGRRDEVLRLVREPAHLTDLREILPRAQVLRVIPALEPGAPAAVHLLERLVEDAPHERAKAPGRRRCLLRVGLREEVRVLEEGLDLLLPVRLGDERDPRLAELVRRDVAADAVLGERQDLVPLRRIGVPDEVAQEEVGLAVEPALRVVLGDALGEPQRQEVDRGRDALRSGLLHHLLDVELVHHLVGRDLDELRVIAEVRDRHLEVLGRGDAEDRLAHLEDVLGLELPLRRVEDVGDPPRRVVVELVDEPGERALDRGEGAPGLGRLAPVVVEPDAALAAAGGRDVHVLPGEVVPGDLVLARALRQHERLVEAPARPGLQRVHGSERLAEVRAPERLGRRGERQEGREGAGDPSHRGTVRRHSPTGEQPKGYPRSDRRARSLRRGGAEEPFRSSGRGGALHPP